MVGVAAGFAGIGNGCARRAPVFRGDRIQIQQVILNLLNNGIEAMISITGRPRTLTVRSERLNGSPIRVNCIRFGGTDVTITDVTSNPATCSKPT